jgi:hypothetical protein
MTSIYWHDSVSAGGDVARAREIQIGRVPANLTASFTGNVNANLDLGLCQPVGSLRLQLDHARGNTLRSIGDTARHCCILALRQHQQLAIAFGDLLPMFQLKWNAGVNNFMTYVTGDVPVGAYQSTRLANIGLGHWAIDAGGGYTYFDPKTGHEASAVLGFTYNFVNPSTQYQSGVDMHLDWGVSQFLTKQWQVGLVGYLYQEIGCDSGSGDRVGCFRSRVVGVGPQVGYIFPVGDKLQGYLNLKAYGEFANENRPAGWNLWLTFNLSPAAATPPTSRRPTFTK